MSASIRDSCAAQWSCRSPKPPPTITPPNNDTQSRASCIILAQGKHTQIHSHSTVFHSHTFIMADESKAIHISDLSAWAALLHSSERPLLVHLNGDTTWLLQLPLPATLNSTSTSIQQPRTHFNILIDPWLQGPQSDVASWFSTQWHIVPPSLSTLAELNGALKVVEQMRHGDNEVGIKQDGIKIQDEENKIDLWRVQYIDAVAISHEFTDHCHKETLQELPPKTTVFAADTAADLIRSWNYFEYVTTAPGFTSSTPWTNIPALGLPSWLRIARIITPNNALYYHSALIVSFSLLPSDSNQSHPPGEAIVYSPHGIQASDLSFLPSPSSNLSTLALLHGLHDVRIFLMKQLNLGGLNAIDAVRASAAKYWIATHDEVKTGGGLIAPLLVRTAYTIDQATEHDSKKLDELKAIDEGADFGEYQFLHLESGDAQLLI